MGIAVTSGPSVAPLRPTTPVPVRRLLLILREGSERNAMQGRLERDGFLVHLSGGGVDGIAAAERGGFDLVLVDLHLPDLDGTAVTTHLRRAAHQVPVVGLAQSSHEHKLALSAGCHGVVDAPADLDRLGSQLSDFIEGKREKLRNAREEKALLAEVSAGLATALEIKVQELKSANERLTAIDRFKSEFLQSITHELTQPLTPLLGYLKILRSGRLGAIDPRVVQVLEAMQQSCDRMHRTVDQLADFSSLDSGQVALRPSMVDPAVLLRDAVTDRHPLARSKRIQVRMTGVGQGQLSRRVDAPRLQQLFAHLVENAIKFSPAGSDVLAELRASEGGLQLDVWDQGAGIPKGEHERIFEPFHHVERAGAGEAGGAGLGLAVCRRVAEGHGGSLTVESPPRSQPEGGRLFNGCVFHLVIKDLPDDGTAS